MTSGGAIVPSATLSAPGTVSVPVTAGQAYQVRVVGVQTPGAANGNNAALIQVTSPSGAALPKPVTTSFVDPKLAPQPQPAYEAVIPLTLPTTGDYTVTLTDHAAPVALNTLFGVLLSTAPGASTIPISAGTSTLSGLAAGSYRLTLIGISDALARAGLFGIKIAPVGGGQAVIDSTVPIGAWVKTSGTDRNNGSTQPLTLTVTDLATPAALSTLQAVVTVGAAKLGAAGNGAPATFSAPAGLVSLWQLPVPVALSAGTYRLSLAPASGTALYAETQTITAAGSNLYSYTIAVAAGGSYVLSLADLQFPNRLTTLTYELYQGSVKIASGAAPGGSGALPAVTLAAGTAQLFAHAVPDAALNGAFVASLAPAAGGTALFVRTVIVGPNLVSVPFSVSSAGAFDVALTDLGWPAKFHTWNGLISKDGPQGSFLPISLFGNQVYPNAALDVGSYVLTLNAVPASGQVAGLYFVGATASVPTVTVTAAPTTAKTGTGTHLTWSSTGATSCTASTAGGVGGATKFTGSVASTGAADDGPYTSTGTVTYTLSCSGDGGDASGSATVTVTAGSSSGGGGGGGGALDAGGLALLGLLALGRGVGRRAAARTRAPDGSPDFPGL